MEKAKITFGRKLRKIRKSRGLTLETLGQAASIGYKHIADIERGLKVPSFDAIDRLAAALNVRVHELFFTEEEGPASIDETLRALMKDLLESGQPNVKRGLANLLTAVRELQSTEVKRG